VAEVPRHCLDGGVAEGHPDLELVVREPKDPERLRAGVADGDVEEHRLAEEVLLARCGEVDGHPRAVVHRRRRDQRHGGAEEGRDRSEQHDCLPLTQDHGRRAVLMKFKYVGS
jgi:hypothetical protein